MNQLFNVTVISLTDAIGKQDSAKKQLDEYGIIYDIEVFDRPTTIYLKEYDEKSRMKTYGRDMLIGEIGCFLSHRAVWEKASNSEIPTLILEDDFQIVNNFTNYAHKSFSIVPDFGIIRMHAIFEKKMKQVGQCFDKKIVTYSGNPAGSVAYIVSPSGAKILLERSSIFYVPVDDFIDQVWRHGLSVYGIYPYAFSVINFESDIGLRKKSKLPLLKKISVEYHRGKDSIKGRLYLTRKKYFRAFNFGNILAHYAKLLKGSPTNKSC